MGSDPGKLTPLLTIRCDRLRIHLLTLQPSKKIVLRESKRNNAVYRQHALACLADFVELRESIKLGTEVYEITAPIIEEVLVGPEVMDHDMQSGGLPSKTVYELALRFGS